MRYKMSIELIVISKNGITITFNLNHQSVWFVLPGSCIKKDQKSFKKAFFPGVFDPIKLVNDLNTLPIIDSKKFSLDFGDMDELPILIKKEYLRRSYNPYSDKTIPIPSKSVKKLLEISKELYV